MKKVLRTVLVIFLLLGLTGCGNKDLWGFGHYTFTRIHILNPDGEDVCLEVKQWTESDVGIEVDTVEYGPLFLSEGTYIMVNQTCPFCDLGESHE